MRAIVLAPVLLLAVFAANAAPVDPMFPSCVTLEGQLTDYRTDIAGIQESLQSIKVVANVIDPLGAISCEAKEDICKLSGVLTKIDVIGGKLQSIPNIGTVLKAMSISAKAANIPAKQLCTDAKALCNSLPGPSGLARLYIQQYPNLKTAFTAADGLGTAGLVAVTTATTAGTPFCDGADVDSSCAAVLAEIAAAEAAAEHLKEELEKLVSQQLEAALQQLTNALDGLTGSLSGLMPTFDVLDDIFSGLDALNLPGLPGCTPAVPEVCTPGVPKKCVSVPYPCGVKMKCCKKILGKCVCKTPVTKWCDATECTPAIPEQCTPAIPEFCPMDAAIDGLFDALGISGIPGLPGLGFLDMQIPSLPEIGFYELTFGFNMPNLIEEFSVDLPSLPEIDFDVPEFTLSFPTCLAV